MHTKNISLQGAENLIRNYRNAGGEAFTIEDGCLGLGVVVLTDFGTAGLRAFVIEEVYLNEWSSGHILKIYEDGKLPAKYQKAVDAIPEN